MNSLGSDGEVFFWGSMQAEMGGSVVFFDGPNQRFIRGNSMAIQGEVTCNIVFFFLNK